MATAYLVTKGQYSDYHILAVFTNEVDANAFAKAHDEADGMGWPQAKVEEVPLNVPFEERATVGVQIDRDGTVTSTWVRLNDGPATIDPPPGASVGGFYFTGYGRSVEHARRSAEEMRRQTRVLEGT